MNIDYRTSFFHGSWHLPVPGRKVTLGWWLRETVDVILPSPKSFIEGPDARFLYHKLAGGDEIRVLCLCPGQDADPLIGRMLTTRLTDNNRNRLEYDAISYVWGGLDGNRTTMDIDGTLVNLQPSLASALFRLRHPTDLKHLWMDAICIDQHNVEERNEQVSMMSQIYKSARQVCVCLGPSTNESDVGMKALETMYNEPLEAWGRVWQPAPDLVRAGIRDVMGRTWWQRTWCVQEAVVAKKVVMICGDMSLIWPNMARHVYLFLRSLKAIALSPSWLEFDVGADCLHPFVELLGLQLEQGPDSAFWEQLNCKDDLLDWTYSMRDRQSSDPRDKFYGLLGLDRDAFQVTKFSLFPDYTKSLEDVFDEWSRKLLPRHPFGPETTESIAAPGEFPIKASSQGDQMLCDQYTTATPSFDGVGALLNGIFHGGTWQDFPTPMLNDRVRAKGPYQDVMPADKTSHPLEYTAHEAAAAILAIKVGRLEHAAEIFEKLGADLREKSR